MMSRWWWFLVLFELSILLPLFSFTYKQPPSSKPPHFTNMSHASSPPRTAVCLVGSAGRFELTAFSLLQNLLASLPENSDVFVNAPLDKDGYKLFFLSGHPRIAGVQISEMKHISETSVLRELFAGDGSPEGIQGLLGYFSLLEGCLAMIRDHQRNHTISYQWVVRARLDSFWSGPLPPTAFVPDTYIAPLGLQFSGLNDRFSVSSFQVFEVAMSRLSAASALHAKGLRKLNSEKTLAKVLEEAKVEWDIQALPFCIVSERRYPWPPGRWGLAVAKMTLHDPPLSGAECRPCRSECTGECAIVVWSGLQRKWSSMEGAAGAELCNASGGWEKGWERAFEDAVGKEMGAGRRMVEVMTVKECQNRWRTLKNKTERWSAPPLDVICRRGLGWRYFVPIALGP